MKLQFVVLYKGQSRLDAVVEEDTGKRRRVGVSWLRKEKSDLPPADWLDQVLKEIEFQKSIEKQKADGKWLG